VSLSDACHKLLEIWDGSADDLGPEWNELATAIEELRSTLRPVTGVSPAPMPRPFGVVWEAFWKQRRGRGERWLPSLVRSFREAMRAHRRGKLAQVDASYVLDWLRQTDAPENIIRMQRRIVVELGGYLGFRDRTR